LSWNYIETLPGTQVPSFVSEFGLWVKSLQLAHRYNKLAEGAEIDTLYFFVVILWSHLFAIRKCEGSFHFRKILAARTLKANLLFDTTFDPFNSRWTIPLICSFPAIHKQNKISSLNLKTNFCTQRRVWFFAPVAPCHVCAFIWKVKCL
jgi:hypothetical protein